MPYPRVVNTVTMVTVILYVGLAIKCATSQCCRILKKLPDLDPEVDDFRNLISSSLTKGVTTTEKTVTQTEQLWRRCCCHIRVSWQTATADCDFFLFWDRQTVTRNVTPTVNPLGGLTPTWRLSAYLTCNGHPVEDVPHDNTDNHFITQVENDTFAIVVNTVSGLCIWRTVSSIRLGALHHSSNMLSTTTLQYLAMIFHSYQCDIHNMPSQSETAAQGRPLSLYA